MKFALPATLALGGFSLLLAAVAAFTFYLDWLSQPTFQVPSHPPSIAASVAAAQDISSLKLICRSLAEGQDTTTAFLQSESVWLKRSFAKIASFSFGWGLVCGIAFLYIHFLLRKLSRERRDAL